LRQRDGLDSPRRLHGPPQPDGPPDWLGRLEWAAAITLTLLALFLHLSRSLHAGALWRDEAAAVSLATLPRLADVYAAFPHEAFPLLFPLTVRGYAALAGSGDAALRAFGLGIGAALLAALWSSARAAAPGGALPLAALALLGFNPTVLRYGDEVRGYGLGSVLVVLAFGLTARALRRPSRAAAAGAWLAALGAAHCLLQSSALLLGLGLAAALTAWRRAGWRAAAAVLAGGAAIAVSLLPYAGPLRAAREWDVVVKSPLDLGQLEDGLRQALGSPWQQDAWLAALGLAAIAGIGASGLTGLAGGAEAGGASGGTEAGGASGGAEAAGAEAAGAEAGGARGSAGSAAGRTAATVQADDDGASAPGAEPDPFSRRERVIFGAVSAALATIAFGGFLFLLGYAPRPWYYLPLLALLAAAGDLLLAGAGRPVRAVLLAGVAAAAPYGLFGPAAAAARTRLTNVDQLAAVVAEGAAAGDLVLVNPWSCGISFNRYYHGAAPWTTLPALADHRFHRYDLLKAKMSSPRPIDDVIDRLGRTLRGGHRVWLVGGVGLSRTPEPVVPLPPAPRSPTGWYDLPYTLSWSRQAGAFLQAHTVEWQGVRLSGGDPIDPLERLPLLVAYGWK
jgi:hypothetical protein